MRKLLVLLSVVLLFAICQSQKIKDKKVPPKIRDCFFGYKKVNGTTVCKTKAEFMKHPKNDTNCTHNRTLRCQKVDNVTICRCLRRIKPVHPIKTSNCTKGYVRRCKVDKFTGKQKCRCVKMGPIIPVPIKDDIVCEEGKVKVCKRNGFCICKKPKPEREQPVVPDAVGLF
jgi:hypothetical protein